MGLIIAVFIVSRRADHRQVAKLALPSGIFQINEPILFGLPIIMNPVMFIPFIPVQPLLAAITLTAYYTGIIPPVTNIAPWTMPAGLGAFFNTNGSVAAFLLAIFNLGIATLLYMPFVAIANKAATVIDEEESEEDIAPRTEIWELHGAGQPAPAERSLKMLDLESIVAEETAENDLEEVVMGLIINSGQARSWRMRRSSRLSRAISLPRKP